MTRFSEKVLISTRCIHGFMSNLIKKSWTDSTVHGVHKKNIPDPRGMSHYTFRDGMKIPKIMTRFFTSLLFII